MRKSILTLFALAFLMSLSYQISAQGILKAPKQFSIDAGWSMLTNNTFGENNIPGYNVSFDYAWKLSGFESDHGTYLSVPLGYSSFPKADSAENSIGVLIYGWTVRHELPFGEKLRPFLGYGLLLNQLRISGTEGSIFGHQTRFDLGANYKLNDRKKIYAAISYSLVRFPRFGQKKSDRLNRFGIKIGYRF
ncbi:MAG: outer membrane beta-barrel protein [Bacteroidales bacterium]|nr:outer membrane beta-barrel protein [Bacteroidales bacterium]